MTGVDDEVVELYEETQETPVDEGGFTPEGPSEELTSTPAAPPGPFDPDGPISRGDVLVRAQSWVDEQVPYSQTVKHTNSFGSYRADCSGFVSMAWHLSASLTTFSLPDVMTDVPRADLEGGDALWQRADGAGHIALFLRWADADRTMPVVQEEYDFGEVAEERTWTKVRASGFTPKRYKRITDGGAFRTAVTVGDGSLVQAPGTPVAVLAGGARIALSNQAEIAAIGAADEPVHALTRQAYTDLPTIPADGTLLSGKPALPAALVIGGARLNLASVEEITETGHGGQRVQPIPARAFRAMTGRIADGTLITATGLPVAVIVGGGRINLRDADEVAAAGPAGEQVRRVPRRVFNGLSGRIADGTLVSAAGAPLAVIVGGARINFRDADEVVATGNHRKAVRTLPRRVLNGLTGKIEDGTLISAPGLPAAVIVGGARVNLRDADEIIALGLAGAPAQSIPERVFTGLSGAIADGTLLRTPSSPQVWRMAGGRRSRVNGGAAQLVPERVLNTIAVAG